MSKELKDVTVDIGMSCASCDKNCTGKTTKSIYCSEKEFYVPNYGYCEKYNESLNQSILIKNKMLAKQNKSKALAEYLYDNDIVIEVTVADAINNKELPKRARTELEKLRLSTIWVYPYSDNGYKYITYLTKKAKLNQFYNSNQLPYIDYCDIIYFSEDYQVYLYDKIKNN